MSGAESPEGRLCGGGRHRLNAEREEEDERQQRQHHHPFQRRAEDRLVDRRRGGDQERHEAGDDEAKPHEVVDPQHVLAQALVEDGLGTGGAGLPGIGVFIVGSPESEERKACSADWS